MMMLTTFEGDNSPCIDRTRLRDLCNPKCDKLNSRCREHARCYGHCASSSCRALHPVRNPQ
jgi:hypothetical protein